MVVSLPTLCLDPSWPGWTPAGTVILPLPASAWAPPAAAVRIAGLVLAPKQELHVTLVGSTLGEELHRAFAEPHRSAVVRAAFLAQSWSFGRTGHFRLLRRTEGPPEEGVAVHSLIEHIRMPALPRFHAALGRALGRELPIPPAHVTLHVAGSPRGIGVASARELRAYTTRELSAEELRAAGGSVP